MKVSFSSLALAGDACGQSEPRRQTGDQQTSGGDQPAGSTLAPVTEPAPSVAPPVAPREPFEHTEHGVARPDPTTGCTRSSPQLTEHLSAERGFYDSSVAHLHPLVSTLKAEMFARLPAAEVSARWRRTRFSYYTAHLAGNDYAHIVREIHGNETVSKQISPVLGQLADENRNVEVLLDVGSLADDSGYLELGVTLVSPDEDLLAYSVDTTGDEVYALRFRDLRTGADLDEVVPRSYYGGAWSADSQWFFYTVHDEAYRPYQVWRHRIGTPVAEDVLVLEEPDERFDLNVRASRVRRRRAAAQREPRHRRGVGDRRPRTRVAAAVGRRPPAGRASTAPSTCAEPARVTCCWSPTTTRSSSGWSGARSRSTPTRTTRPGSRRGRRTRPSGWSGSTRSPATSC